MPKSDPKNWDNYWQGRSSQRSGNALVEVGIENNHTLNEFWIGFFHAKSKSSKIVDFACGAGSVLKHANSSGFRHLTGVDISPKALDIMQKKIPGAMAICSPVDKTPLEEASFDIAVSQFGIEYAGSKSNLLQAFQEMHRILKPGGEICVISHAENSVIHKGCLASLSNIKTIETSGFIETAKTTLSKLYSTDDGSNPQDINRQITQLNQSAQPIMEWLKTTNRDKDNFAQFAYNMLEASHKLITRYQSYSPQDALNWLKGIESELAAYKGRMTSMTQASQCEENLSKLIKSLDRSGSKLQFSPLEKFYFPPNNQLAAWIIRAST